MVSDLNLYCRTLCKPYQSDLVMYCLPMSHKSTSGLNGLQCKQLRTYSTKYLPCYNLFNTLQPVRLMSELSVFELKRIHHPVKFLQYCMRFKCVRSFRISARKSWLSASTHFLSVNGPLIHTNEVCRGKQSIHTEWSIQTNTLCVVAESIDGLATVRRCDKS